MNTLAQRRAGKALAWKDKDFGGKNQGNVVSGFPLLIHAGGLLPALAYAIESKQDRKTGEDKPKNAGEYRLAEAIADHLTTERILKASTTPKDMVKELAGSDAQQLRRATAETLAFLSYLKRFVA